MREISRVQANARETLVGPSETIPLTIMGRGEPPPTMKRRLAPDRSLTPTLSQRRGSERAARISW